MSEVDELSRMYLFRTVQRAALNDLVALAPPVHFNRGDRIFETGANADVALLLISGRLVASVGEGKDARTLGDIRPGEIVGEQGLFIPGGQRSATVMAADVSSALLLSPQVMDHAARNPAIVAIEQHLLGTLARRIRSTNQAIQQAWKVEAPAGPVADTAPRKRTLRERLASLFGGE